MREHWDELCHLFEILCYLVEKPYGHGIGVYFTSNGKKFNSKSVYNHVELCKKRKSLLRALTNVAVPLEHILEEYCRSLKDEVESRKRWSPKAPPLSIYVLTNALWSKNSDPEAAIKNVVDSLTTLAYPPSQVGIQFISFGENPDTFKRLENYDSGLGLKM
jgi:hypothetical protein